VTEHPTADWTAQQFRMAVSGGQSPRWLIHDRDSIYPGTVDATLAAIGLTILRNTRAATASECRCERPYRPGSCVHAKFFRTAALEDPGAAR
jgi:hypothetical protein